MGKRVLLTGIGGSIGIHFFVHIMRNTDWHVIGIDSFRHKGWTDRVSETLRRHPEWGGRLTIYTHDLNAPFSKLLKENIGYVDYIISMASLSDVEASIQDPVPFIQNNVNLTLNMLEFARGVWGLTPSNQTPPQGTAFIQISTDEVYGPVESKYDDLRVEWDAIKPSNPYAASKACQEAIAFSYWRTFGIPLIITNTMNNFGEMQQASKFPAMIQKWLAAGKKVIIHGSGGKIGSRSYIHSRNFADAILFLLTKTTPHLHVPNTTDCPDRYNIAGDKQLDNLELAHAIAKEMGIDKLDYEILDTHTTRPGHDLHYGLDNKKLYNLGWRPPKTFEETLGSTVRWQNEHKNWIK